MRVSLIAVTLMLVVVTAASSPPPLFAQATMPSAALRVDTQAALLEVVPPAAVQQSPAAVALIDRLMRKHMLMLQHPSLMSQVLASKGLGPIALVKAKDGAAQLASAVRVYTLPETNVIVLAVDPDVGGTDAPMLAEAIVNQHLANEAQLAHNVELERSVILNNLKTRYQFRRDELSRDLREMSVRLSIDGIGTHGRISSRELELKNLLDMQFELERKRTELVVATGAGPATAPSLSPGGRAIDGQLKQLHERIDATKADLGELNVMMNKYLTIKADEETTRELLRDVNDQLDRISQSANATPAEVRWLCRPSRG
jgi:hypothetical protein